MISQCDNVKNQGRVAERAFFLSPSHSFSRLGSFMNLRGSPNGAG
jgi:hypothetical protein